MMEDVILRSLCYSLKVWLTSVVVAPLLFLMVAYLTTTNPTRDFSDSILKAFGDYMFYVMLQFMFSMVTWLMFFLIVLAAMGSDGKTLLGNWIIFSFGIILTMATFMVVFPASDILSFRWYGGLMLANCICIGGGCWFYKL